MRLPSQLVYSLLFLSTLLFGNSADAQFIDDTYHVLTDVKSGFPVCLRNRATGEEIGFAWPGGDLYTRDVKYISLKELSRQMQNTITCEQVPYIGDAIAYYSSEQFNPKDGKVYGKDLPQKIREALSQIDAGGVELREEFTPQAFLEKNPIDDFTVEINRELAAKYGMTFTAGVYREWLLKQGINEPVRKEIAELMKENTSQDLKGKLKEDFKNYLLVFERGYMQTAKKDKSERLYEDLDYMGVPYYILRNTPMASVEENASQIVPQLRDLLENGHNIILIGPSKASPELLMALDEINAEPLQRKRKGKIVGFLGLVALLDGSFIVDYVTRFPIIRNMIAGLILSDVAKKEGVPYTGDGINSLKSGEHSFRAKKQVINSLPQDVVYINILGVLTSNHGIAYAEDLAILQNQVTRSQKIPHGANDALVEYPGTALRHDEFPNVLDVIIDSSHSGLDGSYEGMDLQNTNNRRAFLSSVLTLTKRAVERQPLTRDAEPVHYFRAQGR